jgi:uncharacterized protein (UPF0276 family)
MGRPIPATAGVGLRMAHHDEVLASTMVADWLEVHAENYVLPGRANEELAAIAERYPLSLHAVGLSLGSAEGIDPAHARYVRRLAEQMQAALVSDHLSWSRASGMQVPDLLPLPYTHQSLAVVIDNVACVQDILGRQILVENPSVYLALSHQMTEAEFLQELCLRTGCGVLFDVNNVFVSALNRGVDPLVEVHAYLDMMDVSVIGEIHLAGHATVSLADGKLLRVDDHASRVCDEVWALYSSVVDVLGPCPTLIEWDNNIPPLCELQREAARANRILDARRRDHVHAG